MKEKSYFIIILMIICGLLKGIQNKECPEIRILNPYKSRSWLVEAVQIGNSSIRLIRGGQELGTQQQINNLMVWDTTTNQCLKIFDIQIQISQMIYSKVKRKLLLVGPHKILEIHPLTFAIVDEHNIGGTHIHDLEDSDSLLLIARDQGNPFLYDIYSKQITQTLPYKYLNILGEIWATMANLKDFNLFVNAKLMLFDRNDNYKFISYLGGNNPHYESRVCAFKKFNFLVTSNFTPKIQLGGIFRDSEGVVQYEYYDEYVEVYYPTSLPVAIKFQDLYCVERDSEQFIIASISRDDSSSTLYKGATVLRIVTITDPVSQKPTYKLALQEKWKYRRWRKDMEFFLFDDSTHRAQSISEYEHYSYEFLESDDPQCDFDEDGVIDSYCRMTKTISHWPWNLNMGAYFLGPKAESFFYSNDNQKGYQIRDWNSTEIARFYVGRLIEKDAFSIRRVVQDENSTYKLPYDSFILKMCWIYSSFSEMKADHQSIGGFYIYQQYEKDRIIDTYNLITYLNPAENIDKYKNPYTIIVSFTYKDTLHTCLAYTVLEINQNKNGDTLNNLNSFLYFSHHNKECYIFKDGKVLSFHQLKLPTPILYGVGSPQYLRCRPYFDKSFLICKNPKSMLEFWSMDDYSLAQTVDINNCTGDYDIAIHRKQFYIGCDNSIMLFDAETHQQTTFIKSDNKIPLFIIIVEEILAIAFSTMDIIAYDLRPLDGSVIKILHYYDPQDCCLINSIDIHPLTKQLMWASIIQINYIDLSVCLDNPQNCITCEITSYFKYDPTFSFIQQKYERSKWPTPQPNLYINPTYLYSGLGTIADPFLTDMNIMQVYYKTHYYKQNIIDFKEITLNIHIDIGQVQYLTNYSLDWVHTQTKIFFIPWDSTSDVGSQLTSNKLKIVINSARFHSLVIDQWGYFDMTNTQIVCPNCSSNTLTFKNSGEIYLRNFISSLDIADLIEPQQGEIDKRVFPNIRINVENVDKFLLENQQITNTKSDDLNRIPFFTFSNCKEVRMSNIVFSNIVNQESLFESVQSNFILEDILFTKLNTCEDTITKRTKFSVIPFQNLIAKNIQFIDNQFCDICLFQNLVSSSSNQLAQLVSISNVDVINNKFQRYVNSNVLFLKMSLVSLISSNQSMEISNIKFKNNYGSGSQSTASYYFEIIKLSTVFLKNINIIDENLVGIGTFNKITELSILSINFINSQYLEGSEIIIVDRQKLRFLQNLVLIQEVNKLKIEDSLIIGIETSDVVAVQIEESFSVTMLKIIMSDCLFNNSLFTSISNLNQEISSISLTDSQFTDSSFLTELSHIQVGLFSIRGEKSSTNIMVRNNYFTNNYLKVNANTQKKSTLSLSIDNSISQLRIEDCHFSNYYAKGVIGDLFLNVQILTLKDLTFDQNLINLIQQASQLQKNNIMELIEGTAMKVSFLYVQAQVIELKRCSFQNAISSEGAIQMYPNNNYLSITLQDCIFSRLFATNTATAIYISSQTSPVNITINNCHFNNLWLGNISTSQKAHLYFQSSTTFANHISINNLDVFNIGTLASVTQPPQPSNFIYSIAFNLTLSNTIIQSSLNRLLSKIKFQYPFVKQKLTKDFLNHITDQSNINNNQLFKMSDQLNNKIDFQNLNIDQQKNRKYKQNEKKDQQNNKNNQQNQKNIQQNNDYDQQNNRKDAQKYQNDKQNVRLLSQNVENLQDIMSGEVFYGSSLVWSSHGSVKFDNIEIQGDALINNDYHILPESIQQSSILQTQMSRVDINCLVIKNLTANRNGGIILVSESYISSNFQRITLENVEFEGDELKQQLYEEISSAKALINCLQSDCFFVKVHASCKKSGNEKCLGRIINSQEGSFNIIDSDFSNYKSSNQNGTAIFIFNPKGQFSIKSSKFTGLYTSEYGGALYVYQNSNNIQPILTMSDNVFLSNEAANYGGAVALESLFLQSEDKLNIFSNQFLKNTARISGAIYYSSYYFDTLLLKQNKFKDNSAQMAQDVFSQLAGLRLKLWEEDKLSQVEISGEEQITIVHGSGLQLPQFEVIMYYLDSEGKEVIADVSYLPEQKEIIQIQMSVDKINLFNPLDQNIQQEYYISGNLFSSYNSDTKTIFFSNIDLYGRQNSVVYLIITSPLIKKIQLLDSAGNLTYQPYKLIITVKFRDCSNFEITTNHSIPLLSQTIKKCTLCQELSYSKNKEVCEQCPIGAICKQGQNMIIQEGYWRASYDTYTVLQCQPGFEGCKGGQKIGDQLCLTGYIGPMCIECDLFNSRNEGKYTRFGKSQCKECSFNFLNILMILGIVFISIQLTIRAIQSNSSFLQAKILVRFLKTIKFKRIRDVEQLQSQNILIKILMTYFQLIGIIRTIDIKVPDFLPEMSFYFGNPATNTTINVNCLLDRYLFGIHFVFYFFFLSLLIPFLHFLFLSLVLKTQSLINQETMNSNDLKAAIIFFFTYFQPEFIYQAIQIITCKQIDKISYNQANLSLECNHSIYYFVLLSVIIVLFAFMIPMILYARLTSFHNDESFKDCYTQYKYSQYAFLCINYKPQCFYWEFIRMTERLLFILIASIFNSRQILKIILLIFITEGYNGLLQKKQPFKNDKFNKLEIVANHIISVTLILAIGIYSNSLGYTLDVLFYIIFLFINWILITYILLLVAQEIIYKVIDKMMVLVESKILIRKYLTAFLDCLNKIPLFQLNFDLKVYLNKRKKPILYAKIRETLQQILKINPEDRNVFFLSIKEQYNQSKFISKTMIQLKDQYKMGKSRLSFSLSSPKDLTQQKTDQLLQVQDYSFVGGGKNFNNEINIKNEIQKSEFDSKDKSIYGNQEMNGDYKTNPHDPSMSATIRPPLSANNLFNSGDHDDISSSNLGNSRQTKNVYETTNEWNLKNVVGQSLYQFPVDRIKKMSDNNQNKGSQQEMSELSSFN